MAFYSQEQLNGTGSLTEKITSGKTFTFINLSSGSTYFTIEILRTADGFYSYDPSITPNRINNPIFSNISNITGIVIGDFLLSTVLGQGSSSFVLNLDNAIGASTGHLIATGNTTLNMT